MDDGTRLISGFTRKWCLKERRFETAEQNKTAICKSPLLEKNIRRSVTVYRHEIHLLRPCLFFCRSRRQDVAFDPFITPNPLAKDIDVDKVAADFILVSHGHGDHVADVIEIARRTGATVIASYEVGTWFEGKGLKNVQAMNHGGSAKMDFGRVKLTSAIHSSSMPDGAYGGNPCGFVVEANDGKFYYSGEPRSATT